MTPAEDDGTTDLEAATASLVEVMEGIAEMTSAPERNAEIIKRWEHMMQEAVPEASARSKELIEAIQELDRPMTKEEIVEIGQVMLQMTDLMQRIAQDERPPTDMIVLYYVRNIDERLKNVEGRL